MMIAAQDAERCWTTRRASPETVVVEVNVELGTETTDRSFGTRGKKPSHWEQWFLCVSDRHWDNPHAARDIQLEHLDEMVRRDAGLIEIGDTFCAMQGKYDKRSEKSTIRPEHQHGDYLDRLVTTAADFFEPYADRIVCMGDGNHETAIRKNHETDLLERVCGILTDRTGHRVHHTGYTGFVQFKFNIGNTRRERRDLWYTHGYGGGGPVTKDFIQGNRQLVYIDADMMISGHVHQTWSTTQMRMSIDRDGQMKSKPIKLAKLGTYKDEYGEGIGGFAIERGHGPRPVCQKWLRFFWRGQKHGVGFEFMDAD